MLKPDEAAQIYLITDGKAGDLAQLEGVAQAIGWPAEIRKIAPRKPFTWLMPWFGTDPRETRQHTKGPLQQPFPDIAIATGRRVVTYLKLLKTRSPSTFTVFLKDPLTGSSAADFIWVQSHDRLRAPNVYATIAAPHRLSSEAMRNVRDNPPAFLADLQAPFATVLIGGKSRHFAFSQHDENRLIQLLMRASDSNATLLVTVSRRTPEALTKQLRALFTGTRHYFWDGKGDNPYVAMMALADAVIVTADSINMIGEAAATGKQIHIFWPKGHSAKIERFASALSQKAAVRNFDGTLEWNTYPPLNATDEIAAEIRQRYAEFRARTGPLIR
jgi:uncharacterized protein